MMTRKFSVFAGLGLGVVAALVTASPSLASSVAGAQLVPTGKVVAKGAAVTISVTYTCPADKTRSRTWAQITERVGNKLAHASVDEAVTCDGSEHTVDLTGPAQDVPFKVGTAFVEGALNACDDSYSCTRIPFTGEVRLKKK